MRAAYEHVRAAWPFGLIEAIWPVAALRCRWLD